MASKWLLSSMSHKTQKTQKPAGICFPHWVNNVTWKERCAGNLSRGFKLQVKVTAWKKKPRYEKPPRFSPLGLKITWVSPAIIIASDTNWFGFLASCEAWYAKPTWETVPLSQSTQASSAPCYSYLSNPLAICPYALQNSKSTTVTPEYLLGRYWLFPAIHFLSRLKQGSEKPRKI